ncbi:MULTISPECIES: alpha/beta fold hydrolase [unclassified Ruegeria]|uniref:alpha/beta fold hydrolase n=1 Tax=unclassified Ruegeria TaxID=2625375 RepID=UPI001488A580|nr:alpha/beta fold hydrolase [Ruegeria sp. HKCCD4332]NOD87843.1 alpha/beta fold hydrolase [Ruegeria sp. HKCCD4318]NOE14213.1 alpha/beta fold hydrolase [Ruegeria sp. HKCCD4318-2]NOG08430.1 alpha/beta hydrolase [Ruegeria sp. HKCCD4315]
MIEPLVFLPGLMCDARLFRPQIELLSRARSVTVAPVSGGERIEEIASGLLDQLPLRFALAGHSMGGVVALELVRRAPERISRLCLMATDAQADTPQMAASREDLIIGAQGGRLEEMMRKLVGSDALAPGPRRIPILNDLLAMAEGLGAEVFVRQMRALQRRPDQQAALRKIKVPTLVLCGAHDTLAPVRRHSFMADLIPEAEMLVLQNAGHLLTLEAPDHVNEALQTWLNAQLRFDYG